MQLTKYIILFTVLILTTLVKSSNAETTCTENELGDQTCVTTTTTTVPGVTTGNLLSQDFLDGSWSDNGTGQLNVMHGSGTVAGEHGGQVQSTISLNDTLTKAEINSGFSSTLGADIWFWNSYTQSVTMRQTLTDDNGNSITQSRTINLINNGYQTYTDTIIVGENSQQDYAITSKFDFSVPGNTSGHWGADLKSPTLNVTTNNSTTTTTSETFTYCYDRVPNSCTYDNTALEEIADFKTDDGKSYDEYINEAVKIEDLTEEFKVANIDTTIIVEDLDGKLEEFKIEDYAVETFNNFIEANDLTETFETALIEEDLGKEEFFDTMTDSIKEEFGEEFNMGGDDFKEDLTEEFKVANIDTTIIVEDLDGKIEEFKIEDYAVETFNNFIEANDLTETFETALIEEDLGREEFFDTMTDSIKEEFGEDFDMGGDDFKTEDLTTEGGPSDLTENTVEVKEEETVETETDTTDLKESNDTTTETKVEETPNETNKESETSENVSNESDVDKNTETEGTETETDANENVETEETTGTELATDSIEKKVERIIAKVLSKLDRVEDQVQAIQFVKIQGINASGPSLNVYKKKTLKDNVQLNGVPNPDFFNQLNIEQQQVYTDVNLNVYTNNDPLTIIQNELDNINIEKNRLLLEIQQLKRG